MTDPRTYLWRMLIVLAITGLIIAVLFEPLRTAFAGNPFLNGVIISTAFIGVAFIFRQILRLAPEARWLSDIQKTNKISRSASKPILLATVHVMLSDSNDEGYLSALSLRSVLDGVAARLDEGREISRYLIGLLVFLGLLGTFWGLLQTIGSVSTVVSGLDLTDGDFDNMMLQLRSGLDAPLSGMSTAFSSSLFGLGGSLILGFLDLQLGQAMGRFFNEVEDWLSAFARYNDLNSQSGNSGSAALAHGLSEEGARALLKLANQMERSEADRTSQTQQIIQMNATLSMLAEQMSDDRRLRDQLATLTIHIQSLSQQMTEDGLARDNMLQAELRSLSTAVIKLAESKG